MIIECPVREKRKSVNLCRAFAQAAPRSAEGYVFYGVKDSNYEQWRKVLASKAPYYFIDNSYFDSVRGGMELTDGVQFRITKNRVQVEALRFTSDGERFAALGLEIKPWRYRPDGHWLVIEQSPLFMNLMANDRAWFSRMTRELRAVESGWSVVTRPWSAKKPEISQSLQSDLKGAWKLVTHSSAAAVTAVLEGVSCIVNDMSAISRMQCSTDPAKDQRQRFMGVLADNQWTMDEINNGTAWQWLNRK